MNGIEIPEKRLPLYLPNPAEATCFRPVSGRMVTKILTAYPSVDYAGFVAEKEATWGESQKRQRRTTAARRYFFVRIMLCLQWAAVVGRLRPAGFLCHRSLNPTICRPPRLRARSGLTDKGGSHARH